MPNPTHRANDEQTAAAPADNVRLIVAHGKIKFPNPFSDKINAVFLRNGSHHDALGLTQPFQTYFEYVDAPPEIRRRIRRLLAGGEGAGHVGHVGEKSAASSSQATD